MLLRLRLNQKTLQPGQDLLASRQRQPKLGRVIARGATADADFMGLHATVRSGQFQDNPPLHPVLLVQRDQTET